MVGYADCCMWLVVVSLHLNVVGFADLCDCVGFVWFWVDC